MHTEVVPRREPQEPITDTEVVPDRKRQEPTMHTELKENEPSLTDVGNIQNENKNHTGREYLTSFPDSESLNSRLRKSKETEEADEELVTPGKRHQCDICFRSFHDENKLRRHQPVHTGDKLYQCDKCSRQYAYSNGSKRHKEEKHLVRTENAKRHECDICNKSFSCKYKLTCHKCDMCSRRYKDSSVLKRYKQETHSNTQNEGQLHPCADCGKSFVTKQRLKMHRRIHTLMKSSACARSVAKHFFEQLISDITFW